MTEGKAFNVTDEDLVQIQEKKKITRMFGKKPTRE